MFTAIPGRGTDLHLHCTYGRTWDTHLRKRGSHIQAIISHTLLKRLRPSDKPYEVRDTQLKGLILRVQPSGVMSYYVQYGRGRRISIGHADAISPAQARDQAKPILGEAYAGKDPMAARRAAKAHSFSTFIDEIYRPWAESNLRTAEDTVRRLKSAFPELQAKKLDEITPWLVEKWRSKRLKGGIKPSTANRDLAALKSSLAKAVDWGHLETHPLAKVKLSKLDTSPPTRFLTHNEEARLLKALDDREERLRRERDSANRWRFERGHPGLPNLREWAFADHLKPMVLVSLHTGVRRGELFHLTWSDIDLVHADLTIRGTNAKSGRTRHVPLNDIALQALSSLPRTDEATDGLVFPNQAGRPFDNVQKAWRKTLEAAGIERFRWHDLRHSFASRLVMASVDLNTVRELLGHADYHMTLRYAHLAPKHKADAVARLVLDRPHQTEAPVIVHRRAG